MNLIPINENKPCKHSLTKLLKPSTDWATRPLIILSYYALDSAVFFQYELEHASE